MNASARRSYKAEALKWKRAALDYHTVVCQVAFALTSSGPMTRESRMKIAADLLEKATAEFERSHPVDDEAGWRRASV